MLAAVAGLDLIDETFVVAAPAEVARAVHDQAQWRRWWPDLDLTVFQDRGEHGVRWNVRGALAGSMEVWLEPHGDGVIVHYYLRCDPPPGRVLRPAAARREVRRRALRAKRVFWALKDELEAGRAPGEPRPAIERRPSDRPGRGRAP
jgi:hypothetical protein